MLRFCKRENFIFRETVIPDYRRFWGILVAGCVELATACVALTYIVKGGTVHFKNSKCVCPSVRLELPISTDAFMLYISSFYSDLFKEQVKVNSQGLSNHRFFHIRTAFNTTAAPLDRAFSSPTPLLPNSLLLIITELRSLVIILLQKLLPVTVHVVRGFPRPRLGGLELAAPEVGIPLLLPRQIGPGRRKGYARR